MRENIKLTSVKLIKGLYDNFKVQTVNSEMSLQKLTNRAIDLYLQEENFRNKIEESENLSISGSNF
mgnify:CR=1 FL=1|tara:strand:- start:356 stop:553 length:198 start_codon:yes stop_codon:yes gene_type:complete